MAEQYDLVVLGGGPGGYAAALYAGAAGLNVALVEEDRVGGTCLHRGCIPAKALLQTAEVLRTVSRAGEFGVHVGEPGLELLAAQTRKQQIVDRLTRGTESLLKGRNVTVVAGRGVLADGASRTVAVDGGTELSGDNLILATGSLPRSLPRLDFDGTRILSSDHVLTLTEVPARVAIVGAGAVGCEFASLLADLGSSVTLLEVLPRVLPGVDGDVSTALTRSFTKRGIVVHTDTRLTQVEGTYELTLGFESEGGRSEVVVDKLIVSVGRRPRTSGVGFEEAGIALGDGGYVTVDPYMRTSVEHIYAVGDIVATPQLAHVGFAEAIVAVRTMLGEPVTPIDYDRVPWGIYCHPEVGFAGLSEEQARERGLDVVTSTHRFVADGRALILGETDGFVKVIAERDGPIVGVHVIGPHATELVAEGYLAVNWEAMPAEVGMFIHPHPTLSEVFGEAALALTGRGLHA